jgi:two-component system sensor histidine kinase CreC
MRLGTRIFFAYLVIFAVCFYYPLRWSQQNLRTRYLEGVEDPLVDQANILASLVGTQMTHGCFDPDRLMQAFEAAYGRRLTAQIYTYLKTDVDIRVYITDRQGRLIFDSRRYEPVGTDYSRWRDVRLTLDGQYGARTTPHTASDPTSSVLHVAAPVMVDGQLAGVLTVAKPTTSINSFLSKAKPAILRVGVTALLAAGLLSWFASLGITRPIRRLTRYATRISKGDRVAFPRLDRSEIGQMGRAFERMKEALEGKKYVETYVQNLTHEIKSPLSAIRGAAELLQEPMPDARRERFLANINSETRRIQQIVDRMLELASLESRKALDRIERLDLAGLVRTAAESGRPLWVRKSLDPVVNAPRPIWVEGDAFLLHRALMNLLQNAIDFSPAGGRLIIEAGIDGQEAYFRLQDEGGGIPDYALGKVFDKFFSLQRPEGGKSTGLGLNFVREVAMLQHGSVLVENRDPNGVCVQFRLPLALSEGGTTTTVRS